jgi:hypothetical protein
MQHQLLRYVSKLHVEIGFLPEKFPLHPDSGKNLTIFFGSDMQALMLRLV